VIAVVDQLYGRLMSRPRARVPTGDVRTGFKTTRKQVPR
jgi:hypothetical protein